MPADRPAAAAAAAEWTADALQLRSPCLPVGYGLGWLGHAGAELAGAPRPAAAEPAVLLPVLRVALLAWDVGTEGRALLSAGGDLCVYAHAAPPGPG